MKKLLQAVDIKKCTPLFKKGIASLIICSMLMIDVAKAMDEEKHDLPLLIIAQRTPSLKSPDADLRSIENDSTKTRSNEEDPLLDSDPSSFSSSDSDEDSSLEGVPHSEGFPNILPARWKSAPNTIPGTQPLRAGHNSPQLQVPLPPKSQELSVNGDGEIEIVVDNNSTDLGSTGPALPQLDENLPPPSHSRFLPTCVSNFFSKYTFWPERPKYTLGKVAVDETSPATLQEREEAEALRIVNSAATYFLDSLPKQVPENHSSGSEEERSSSFSGGSSGSDSSPQRSPTSPRNAALLKDDSESEGDGPTAQLLPHDHPHRTMNYASFKGIPLPSGSFASPHYDQDFDPTVVILHPSSLPSQTPWLQFLDGLKSETKTHLINFTDRVLHGQTTWPGRLGKWIIGPLIGAGFAIGMGPVYSGGLTYLADQVPVFKKFISGTAGNIFIWYITASAFEGIFRNSLTYKQGFEYFFSSEKKEIGRMCITGAVAAVTAFIPVAYLILSENMGRELLDLSGWDNQFGVWVAACGPPLYLDALGNASRIAWDTVPKLKKGFRQFREVFCPSFFSPQPTSPEEILRENFDHSLLKLKQFLRGASDTLIEKIYGDIEDILSNECIRKDQKAAGILAYLLSLGDQVQKVTAKNAKKSLDKIFFDCFKYTSLILGAPTIALLLQLVGSTVASLFTSNTVAESIGEAFALVAFLPFNYVLAQFMDNFKNLLSGEDPQGYENHPAARLPVKVFIGIQSLIYLFQTSIAVLQSYQKWFGDGWWPFAAGIPFFIPKLMELSCNFYGSFNGIITTSVINLSHRIGGRCKGKSLCPPCRKGKLIRDIEDYRRGLGGWDPKSIHGLSQASEFFKRNGGNISFEETL